MVCKYLREEFCQPINRTATRKQLEPLVQELQAFKGMFDEERQPTLFRFMNEFLTQFEADLNNDERANEIHLFCSVASFDAYMVERMGDSLATLSLEELKIGLFESSSLFEDDMTLILPKLLQAIHESHSTDNDTVESAIEKMWEVGCFKRALSLSREFNIVPLFWGSDRLFSSSQISYILKLILADVSNEEISVQYSSNLCSRGSHETFTLEQINTLLTICGKMTSAKHRLQILQCLQPDVVLERRRLREDQIDRVLELIKDALPKLNPEDKLEGTKALRALCLHPLNNPEQLGTVLELISHIDNEKEKLCCLHNLCEWLDI